MVYAFLFILNENVVYSPKFISKDNGFCFWYSSITSHPINAHGNSQHWFKRACTSLNIFITYIFTRSKEFSWLILYTLDIPASHVTRAQTRVSKPVTVPGLPPSWKRNHNFWAKVNIENVYDIIQALANLSHLIFVRIRLSPWVFLHSMIMRDLEFAGETFVSKNYTF